MTKTEEGTMIVDFFARKKLELNITHIFLETALKTLAHWNKQAETVNCHILFKPNVFALI